MHILPLDWDATDWQERNGPLTAATGDTISSFLTSLTGQESISRYALIIFQLSVGMGGMGILYAIHCAAPDFVITMTAAMRIAGQGFQFNKDLEPLYLHPTISDLYLQAVKPQSLYFQQFQLLLPSIAEVFCSPKYPVDDCITHFLTRISSSSARSRTKKHCSASIQVCLYQEIQTHHSHHLHHLASILVPHTSYLPVAMCQSVPSHQLHNWNLLYTILRKIRLPIYEPIDCPTCWCGKTYDCWGNHVF